MSESDDVNSDFSDAIVADDANALKRAIQTHSVTDSEVLGGWLIVASSEGSIACAKVLIESGANVNVQTEDGETAFSYACARNRFEVAKLLHANGADINTLVVNGSTPLDWAVCWSSPEFRDWLRSVGGVRNLTFEEWPWPPPSRGE